MDDFAISSSGVLTFRSAPDYEMPMDMDMDNMYMVTAITGDSMWQWSTHHVTVTVTMMDQIGRVTFWRDGADATEARRYMVGDMLTGLVDTDMDGTCG